MEFLAKNSLFKVVLIMLKMPNENFFNHPITSYPHTQLFSSFENNWGGTNGRTDGTSYRDASKKEFQKKTKPNKVENFRWRINVI